jgi:hypothetical protein
MRWNRPAHCFERALSQYHSLSLFQRKQRRRPLPDMRTGLPGLRAKVPSDVRPPKHTPLRAATTFTRKQPIARAVSLDCAEADTGDLSVVRPRHTDSAP